MMVRRVNTPFWASGEPEPAWAIFWLGKVESTKNYSDVRLIYDDEKLTVSVLSTDRRIWRDESPSVQDLTDWDAVTLYLDLESNGGATPSPSSYQFVAQFGAGEGGPNFQANYIGNGSSWVLKPILFSVDSAFRGNWYNDDIDDKGWLALFAIPFDSLGLSGPPSKGTVWDLGIAVHDRDDTSGTPITDQVWPEQMDPNKPVTWSQLHFGLTQYNKSNILPQGLTMIQEGFNGVAVPDAHVGGNFTCGDSLDHWSEWGEANYAGSTQINIQNQWDIADYPCFSKYYVKFPMDSVPIGKVVVSARLRMTMFGNAGGGQWGEPPDSYIQVFTISEEWDESTLNWNNAPLALENISGTWVKPTQTSKQREYSWDVSKAVMDAYQSGQPVRLALYSSDGERHTGKYFWTSDSNDWGGTVRPRLIVTWGTLCGTQDVVCNYTYVPAIRK